MIRIGNKKFNYDGQKVFYVGRPSPLGNPFPTKRNSFSEKIYTVADSLKLYKKWLWEKIKSKDAAVLDALEEIAEAEEITLLCWCVDADGKGECHARIIIECVEWLKNQQKEKMNKFEENINSIQKFGSVGKVSAATAASSANPTIAQTVEGSPELAILPLGKIIETFQKNTTLKARALLMDLFWFEIAVKGSILDVQGEGETFPGTARLIIKPFDKPEQFPFSVTADFKVGPANECEIYKKLLELGKGQSITIAGMVDFLTRDSVRLKDCRILT